MYRTTQCFLHKPVFTLTCTRKNSRAGLWHRAVLWEQCLHQLHFSAGLVPLGWEVVLTHQSHIKLCWLVPAKWPPGTPPHLGIGKNSAPNCPFSLLQQLTLICQLRLCNCLTMSLCLNSRGPAGPQRAAKYCQLISRHYHLAKLFLTFQ